MNKLFTRSVIALSIVLVPLFALGQQQKQELAFVENKGQWPSVVLYQAQLPELNVWITRTGVTYDYFKPAATGQAVAAAISPRINGQVVRFSFINVKKQPAAQGTHQLSGSCNFLAAASKGRETRQARRYAEVLVNDIYPGISQRWYFQSGRLRYDFLLDAGADPGIIKLRMEGVEHAAVTTAGELRFDTRFGEVRQAQLLAYQEVSGQRLPVNCGFRLQPGNILTYAVSNADPKLPLIIDPVIYSTFVGGNGTEETGSHGMTIDAAGNAYVCGRTTSLDFPLTPGAYNSVNQVNNVFVTKINPSGNGLVYSTLVGPGNCGAIAVDAAGNVYISGDSYGGWPITSGAYNANAGSSPSFLTKLNAAGTALIYSSYIGRGMTPHDIKVDAAGNAYVTGTVSSITALTPTAGAYDMSYGLGTDGFVMKMNPAGSARVYATFLGGNGEDYCNALAIDASGNAYVTGRTNTSTFPVTTGAYQTLYHPGYEAFITKLNPSGTGLVYSTFVGGSGDDRAFGLAMDASGNVTITGWTTSTDFPVTAGVYQPALTPGAAGSTDAFVFKLNPAGAAAVYSTYLGGPFNEFAQDIALDPTGAPVICGWTRHAGFPVTAGSLRKPDITTTDFDAFVSRLNTTGTALTYSTLLGSSDNDDAKTIKIDNAGNGYVFGGTNAQDFFTTPGTLDSVYAAGNTSPDGEAFLTKLDFVACNATAFGTATSNTDTLCKDDLLQLSAGGGYKYRWRGPQGWLTNYSDTAAISLVPNYGGPFVVTVFASNGCTEDDTVRIVYDAPAVPVIVRSADTLLIFFNTAAGYQWYLNGSPVPGASNPKLLASQNGSYTVRAISASGCTTESSPFNLTNVAVPGGVRGPAVTVYPNPFDAFIRIEGTLEPMQLQLTDVSGRIVAEGNQQLKTDALPPGFYLLQVSDRKGKVIQRQKMLRQ